MSGIYSAVSNVTSGLRRGQGEQVEAAPASDNSLEKSDLI